MKRGLSTGLGGAASGSAVGRSRVPQVGDAVECETSADFSWQLRWLPGSVTWVDAKTKKMSVLVRRALKDDRVVLSSDEEYKFSEEGTKWRWPAFEQPSATNGKRRRAANPEGPALVLGGGEAIPQLGALRREGKFCDVTVRVGDQRFPAHRVVLSAQSMFLAALFDSGLKDSASAEVELKELEPSVFALAMDYMYDGTCTVPSASTLEPVLAAASLLQVDSLVSAAAAELETRLTPGNCVRALACADRHHLPQLAARAEAVAAGAFVEAASDASMPVSSLRALLQSDAINVKTEQEVYETLSTWLKNQAVPLSEEAQRNLFSLVRLPLLPKPFIQSTVMEEAALSTVQGYKLLLTQLLGPTPAERNGGFVPAPAFAGSQPGYVFKVGPQGLGYYADAVPQPVADHALN